MLVQATILHLALLHVYDLESPPSITAFGFQGLKLYLPVLYPPNPPTCRRERSPPLHLKFGAGVGDLGAAGGTVYQDLTTNISVSQRLVPKTHGNQSLSMNSKQEEPPLKRVRQGTMDNTAEDDSDDASATNDWMRRAVSQVDGASHVEPLRTMQNPIKTLTGRIEAKLRSIKEKTQDFSDGCLVELVDSNQRQDQDLYQNMCTRQVEAKFTAGPKAAPFGILFNVTDYEGDEEVMIDSELFSIEMAGDETMKDCFRAPTVEDIDDFLTQAGLRAAQTRLTAGKKDLDDRLRMKFVYAEVIREALDLVGEKHGWQDDCGIGLGLGSDDIYELFNLDY